MKRIRIGLLDIATIGILSVAVYMLVRPGSTLHASVRRRLAERQLEAAARASWADLVALAQPLYSEGGEPSVIEFSDYECPFCRAAAAPVDSAVKSGLRVATIQLPLRIHQRARSAALAALCAGRAGAFREANRRLMTDDRWQQEPTRLNSPSALGIADSAAYVKCMATSATETMLARHLELAKRLRVNATPTFLSRSQMLREPPSVVTLTALAVGDSA